MSNASVTVKLENASEVARLLGGIINGISFKSLAGDDLIVVTVINGAGDEKLKRKIRKLRIEGKIFSSVADARSRTISRLAAELRSKM